MHISGVDRPEDKEFLDSRGNLDFQSMPAFWDSALLHPVRDEECIKGQGKRPCWPEGKLFAACLTHDVDRVTEHSCLEAVRRMEDVKSLPGWGSKIWRLRNSLSTIGKSMMDTILGREDPFWKFEKWLEAESRVGAKSTFFFFADAPSRYHVKDCRYRFADRVKFLGKKLRVSDVMRSLAEQGWEIGLHSSYYSFNSADELRRQKIQVESACGATVVSNRQHILHFDPVETPKALCDAGFKYDSSPGFNRVVGFRFGTSLPFYYESDASLPLHIPLHIMDSALFRRDNMDMRGDAAFFYCKLIIDRVAAVGGIVTLSWHHGVQSEQLYPGWFSIYERCLSYLKEKNAWLGSMREIGDWCTAHTQNMTTSGKRE